MPNSRESARGTEPRATLEEKATPQSASLTAFLNSQWSFRCAHKFACGSPLLIGLTSRCFAHRARASCAPAVHAAGDDCTVKRLRAIPLGFLPV